MDDQDHFIQIRIKRPMSQLSVLSAVDEKISGPAYVPVVSLEYGLVPTSSLTPRLRGSTGYSGNAYKVHRSSRAHKLVKQLGKSRHFGGIKLGVPDISDPLKGVGVSRHDKAIGRIDFHGLATKPLTNKERSTQNHTHIFTSEAYVEPKGGNCSSVYIRRLRNPDKILSVQMKV